MIRDPENRLAVPRTVSRRAVLRAAGLAPRMLAQDATPVADQDGLSQEIIEVFRMLPGQQGLKL